MISLGGTLLAEAARVVEDAQKRFGVFRGFDSNNLSMHKILKQEEIKFQNEDIDFEAKANLCFFDPAKSTEEYIQFFKEKFEKKINGWPLPYVRVSPVYQLRRDIRFCFGFDSRLPREFPYPFKAGILLMNILSTVIAKMVYDLNLKDKKGEKYKVFLDKFVGLDGEKCECLRALRNALEHSNYTFRHFDKDTKLEYRFYTSLDLDEIIVCEKSIEKIDCRLQPRKLFSLFEERAKQLFSVLSRKENDELCCNFEKNFDIENWNWIPDKEQKGTVPK